MSVHPNNVAGAVVVPAGGGERRWVFGDRYTIKGDSRNTRGTLGFVEALIPPGGGPPPHIHHNEDEAFYLLDGEIELREPHGTHVVGPGAFVFLPKDEVHSFTNVSGRPARMLIIFTPAGLEEFFRQLGVPAGTETEPPPGYDYQEDVAKALRIISGYGGEYV